MTGNQVPSCRQAEHFRWLVNDIWDARLPALWVVFSAGYLLVGRLQASFEVGRWLSSLAVTVAGALILLMFVRNAVAQGSGGSSSNTALAGLIATTFVGMESFRVYQDVLGSMFAGVFGSMIFVLLWLDDSSPWHRRVKVTFAIMLLPSVGFSLIQLLSTLLVWEVIGLGGGTRQDVPIAAHVSGIVAGMSAFVLTYSALGSNAIWGRSVSSSRARRGVCLISILLLAGVVVYLATLVSHIFRTTPATIGSQRGPVATAS